jgi:anti-anti-sigma factor
VQRLFIQVEGMTDSDTTFAILPSSAGSAAVLTVAGEVDMTTAPELLRSMELVSDQTERVVVDLSAVTFLDSSGLNALLSGRRALDGRGIGLRVVTPEDNPVRRVFEITQLTESLSVVASLSAALA